MKRLKVKNLFMGVDFEREESEKERWVTGLALWSWLPSLRLEGEGMKTEKGS